MAKTKNEYGTFKNGVPYVKYGNGSKTLLVFLGGPGNELPKGFAFSMYSKGFKPFVNDYQIFLLTRKSALSEGCTTKDMSDDYAEMIKTEFGGMVDLIVTISYGSLIAQHFAADHPKLFKHIIIAMVANKMSEEGKNLDLRFAKYLSEGNTRKAYTIITTALIPKGKKGRLMKCLLWLVGGFLKPDVSETFSEDVLIEAKAEIEHDATNKLGKINVPVLMICGDKDYYFPKEYVQEMADLIPNCKLIFYSGKGHNIMRDKRFGSDILDFINQ
ncbi:MAG: alpha/beta fold hydrolase [Promethearchaeota archaeon]